MNNVYFESIKCKDFEIYNLTYHEKRISNTIGLNINLYEYINPPNEKLLKCKVVYSNNSILSISYDSYKKRQINSFQIVYDNHIQYSKKSLNRDNLNKLFLKKNLSDEIIIIKNNFVCDTSIANIAIFYNNKWLTPKKYLLQGTTLHRYVNSGILQYANIDLNMLKKAKKIALLNSMIDFDILTQYTIND